MYPYLLPVIALNCSIRTFLVFCSSLSSSPCSCSICIGIISAFVCAASPALFKKAATVSDSRRVSYTTLLAVVLFLFADNRCADNSSSAGKQQCDPQHEVAVVAGLRILRQFRRYGVGLGDFLGAVFVTVILSAAAAVLILDITLGILGGRLCREML